MKIKDLKARHIGRTIEIVGVDSEGNRHWIGKLVKIGILYENGPVLHRFDAAGVLDEEAAEKSPAALLNGPYAVDAGYRIQVKDRVLLVLRELGAERLPLRLAANLEDRVWLL